MSDYTLYVNEDRTVLVRVWDSGRVEVCTRQHSSGIWGPPVQVHEEGS